MRKKQKKRDCACDSHQDSSHSTWLEITDASSTSRRLKLRLNQFFFSANCIILSVRNNKSFDRENTDRFFFSFSFFYLYCIVLPGEDREANGGGGISRIYNIHHSTAESEHKIHLQKLCFTLGKNSVSILFTLS